MPQFFYIKLGFKGLKIIWACFRYAYVYVFCILYLPSVARKTGINEDQDQYQFDQALKFVIELARFRCVTRKHS